MHLGFGILLAGLIWGQMHKKMPRCWGRVLELAYLDQARLFLQLKKHLSEMSWQPIWAIPVSLAEGKDIHIPLTSSVVGMMFAKTEQISSPFPQWRLAI